MGPPEGSPDQICRTGLEDELQSQLRLTGGAGTNSSTDGCKTLAESDIRKITIRIGEVRMVQQIEHLSEKHHTESVIDLCSLREPKVQLSKTGAPARIAPKVP